MIRLCDCASPSCCRLLQRLAQAAPAPIVKHVDASGGGYYDTDDHGIDIVIAADGKWEWKDYDDPRLMAEEGRLTSEEAVAVMRCAHQVAADLDAGRRWWSVWDEWEPPKGI